MQIFCMKNLLLRVNSHNTATPHNNKNDAISHGLSITTTPPLLLPPYMMMAQQQQQQHPSRRRLLFTFRPVNNPAVVVQLDFDASPPCVAIVECCCSSSSASSSSSTVSSSSSIKTKKLYAILRARLFTAAAATCVSQLVPVVTTTTTVVDSSIRPEDPRIHEMLLLLVGAGALLSVHLNENVLCFNFFDDDEGVEKKGRVKQMMLCHSRFPHHWGSGKSGVQV